MSGIYREVTDWDAEYSVPNHVYLFVNSDSIIAYVKESDNTVHRLKTPLKISRKGRKFVKVTNTDLSKISKEYFGSNSDNVKKYKVDSKGNEYIVEEDNGKYSCTCAGFSFRGKCKHIEAVIESLK